MISINSYGYKARLRRAQFAYVIRFRELSSYSFSERSLGKILYYYEFWSWMMILEEAPGVNKIRLYREVTG